MIVCAGALSCAMGVAAQTTYSGYFLENYDYRFQMNPAFGNEKNFVAMPGLGNLNIGMHGNLHTDAVIYNLNGKTVLFTNPGISASTVMDGIHHRNSVGTENKIDIMSFGFKAWGGYNAVSLSAVAGAEFSVPGSLFSLVKEGATNSNYRIDDINANVHAYGQIAFNHSREIKKVKGLRVGATLKLLIGAGNIDMKLREANLNLGENNWIVQSRADVYASVGGFKYEHDISDRTGKEYVSGADLDSYKPQGFGMGLDLGGEYKWRDFRFSLAILDLGFMNWGKTHVASTNGLRTVETDKYTFNVSDNEEVENTFSKEWDRFTDDLSTLYQMDDNGTKSSRTTSLAATLNIAAEYELPKYRKLRFGFLNSTRFNGPFTYTQFRFSANIRPVKCFSADANFVAGTFGAGFGWLLNFHATGFNLFLGMDRTLGKLAKQGLPLNSNGSVNFGINYPF